MRVRAGLARRVVQVAVACAVGLAGVGLWAGPALAVECPNRAWQCEDWPEVPGKGWMTNVSCKMNPDHRFERGLKYDLTERVRNLTSNELVLAAKNIDCWDWIRTENPSLITGRVLGPGEEAAYKFFMHRYANDSRYDLGVFVRDGSGLRLGGKVIARRNSSTQVSHKGVDINEPAILVMDNLGKPLPAYPTCVRRSLGEDPSRSKSTVAFDPYKTDVTWIYSNGTNLYGVRCGLLG